MPRAARIAPQDCVFHVLTRGNNRQDVFIEETDYRKFVEILRRYKEKYKFKLYHYVVMKNHVHLVLEIIGEGGSLAEIMKGINLSYAQYFKGKYRHIGHFWQDRYKSILISKDNYLMACGSYVELNPVRAGIVEDPGGYRWSSYQAYAYGKKDELVDEHPIYENLSQNELERKKTYREFVKGMLLNKDVMRGEMDHRVIYGSETFSNELKKKYEIEEIRKPKGRPKQVREDRK